MNNKNILSNIGLCKKASKLVSGESMVLDSIKSSKSKIVLIASDCEKNTYDRITKKCNYYKVEFKILEVDKFELGSAIGKNFRVCISIEDEGFKKMIRSD
ncbi:MAG: L7Ae/L30e/S12e/Gadd45 family ribosomal protein [Bacilli bacterium]